MVIENAEIEDIPELFEVFKDYEEQEHSIANSMFAEQGLTQLLPEIDEDAELSNFKELIEDPKKKIIVSKEEGMILGYAYGWVRGEDFYDESQQKGWISAVATRKELRNKGIGSKLCDHLEKWLQQQGCVSIEISCFFRNDGARRLYLRRGYTEVIVVMNKSLHNKANAPG